MNNNSTTNTNTTNNTSVTEPSQDVPIFLRSELLCRWIVPLFLSCHLSCSSLRARSFSTRSSVGTRPEQCLSWVSFKGGTCPIDCCYNRMYLSHTNASSSVYAIPHFPEWSVRDLPYGEHVRSCRGRLVWGWVDFRCQGPRQVWTNDHSTVFQAFQV